MYRRWTIRSIAAMGLLCGLSVILGTVLSIKAIPLGGTYTLNIALNLLPVQLAGLFYGPLGGFFVGILADFFKWLLMPMGAYHPGFSLSLGMLGFLPALILQLLQRQPIRLTHEPRSDFLAQIRLWQLLLGVGVAQLLFSVCLNSFWIATLQGRAMIALLPIRVVNAVIMIPVYSLLLREASKLVARVEIHPSHR